MVQSFKILLNSLTEEHDCATSKQQGIDQAALVFACAHFYFCYKYILSRYVFLVTVYRSGIFEE